MNTNKADIIPTTTVAELLRHYPELETTLKHMAPAFAALQNPILRRTVAKVTTLQQAAKVGNIEIMEMIGILRKQANLPSLSETFYNDKKEETTVNRKQKLPSYAHIIYTLDVRPIIEAGGHPKDEVLVLAEKLQPGEGFQFIAPFEPLPLVEMLRKRGFEVIILEPDEGIVTTYVHCV